MRNIHTAGLRLLLMLLTISVIVVLPAVLLANGVSHPRTMGVTVPRQTVEPQGNLTIRLTSDGIVKDATSTASGFYVVTVRNDTSSYRGIRMTGNDIAGSPYVRYTRVLAPGQSQTFGWFFPAASSVQVVDLMTCRHAGRTCAVADIGKMSTTLTFA